MNPLLVALDLPDLDRAESLARSLVPHVGGFKAGLELIMSEGPRAVSRLADLGLPVFADVKLHDIPNTARGAARGLAAHGARWVTAHGGGGRAMLEAVVEGLGPGAGMLVVTVLTSLDGNDLEAVGVAGPMQAQVGRLAALAHASRAQGVVCSVDEVAVVKETSSDLLAVTPGIRIDPTRRQDQRRVSTPDGAIAAGADLIVVGRAITGAGDPVAAAEEMADRLTRTPPL